ncbi:MAG: hypothetical protein K2X01_10645 [Cyanobacteria bacterium]|nr:hypothetical protein [Cyanobacteriota bacterium]
MTELEMALTLGILPDPVENRVPVDAALIAEVAFLSRIFSLNTEQRRTIGPVNPELWCELLPWHSLN